MLLRKLTVRNFRCHAEIVDVPIHRLTVFIGENDAGKTVLLDALEILLTNKIPTPDDYRQLDDKHRADTIVVAGVFELEEFDTLPEDFRCVDGHTFTLTKTFTEGTVRCELEGRGFSDPRFNSFAKQKADVQKELLEGLELTPERAEPQRIIQFQQLVSSGKIPKVAATVSISFAQIAEHLPRFQYTSSTDYKQPDSMVQRTLQTVVDACLHPINPTTNEPELLPELSQVKTRIQDALNGKVSEIVEILRNLNPKIKGVQVNPAIDFSRSVTSTNLMLDLGQGYQLVSAFGEGTKKKLWIGLLEWERRVQKESENISVFRVYDEPDVNLDYAAERKLFANILDATSKSGSRTQAVICTHAVTLIDRAPAHSINLIKVKEGGERTIEFLRSAVDESIETFLSTIGRAVGITNSALFYERAFIVVEGESEENALPILYRNLYEHSLIEDGIVLINLHSSGAWKSVLSVLQRNKAEITFMLLDQDCASPISSGHVTPDILTEIGYPAEFLSTNCSFIGTKEFEDAFATEEILPVLNTHWPKEDGTAWVSADVDQFRQPETKFSDTLKDYIRSKCIKSHRSTVRKPDLAEKLAQHCKSEGQIPKAIRDVFKHLRIKSGSEDLSREETPSAIPPTTETAPHRESE